VAFGRKLILGVVLVLGIVAAPAAAAPSDTTGLVDPASGEWHLRNAAGAVASFFYGDPGDLPMMGDWDCDGIDTPGLYRRSDGFVYLRNTNTQGVADIFGNPGDLPLAGDFNGDGCDTVSIYRPSEGGSSSSTSWGRTMAVSVPPRPTTSSAILGTSRSWATSTATASTR